MKLTWGFKQKMIASLGALLVAMVSLLMLYNYNRVQNIVLHNEEQHNQMIANTFYKTMNDQLDVGRSVLTPIAENKEVIEAFAKEDREELIKLLESTFSDLFERGFYNIQFNKPPAIAFLRLNNLNSFGDDISSIRPTVVEANRTL